MSDGEHGGPGKEPQESEEKKEVEGLVWVGVVVFFFSLRTVSL